MEYNKSNTETFLKKVQEGAISRNSRAVQKVDKDFSFYISTEEVKQEYIGNTHITKMSINNETNKAKITLLNGFVIGFLSKAYDTDISYVKSKLSDLPQIQEFNARIESMKEEERENLLKAL